VDAAHGLASGEVGYRPRHPQYPRIAARRQPHRFAGLCEQALAGFVWGGMRLEQFAVEFGIAAPCSAAQSFGLHLPRRQYPRGDLFGAFRWRRQDKVGGADRLNLDMQVDAV